MTVSALVLTILLFLAVNPMILAAPAHSGAPAIQRNWPSFQQLKQGMSQEQLYKLAGPPDKDIGSGIHIYIYRLTDKTEVWVGCTDKILYVSRRPAGQATGLVK